MEGAGEYNRAYFRTHGKPKTGQYKKTAEIPGSSGFLQAPETTWTHFFIQGLYLSIYLYAYIIFMQ